MLACMMIFCILLSIKFFSNFCSIAVMTKNTVVELEVVVYMFVQDGTYGKYKSKLV